MPWGKLASIRCELPACSQYRPSFQDLQADFAAHARFEGERRLDDWIPDTNGWIGVAIIAPCAVLCYTALTSAGGVAVGFCNTNCRGGDRVKNKLYTIPTCPHCSVARAYLLAKGVDFIEFDVSVDMEALRMMLSMTARTEVPAIVAGDRAVVGFNPASWDELLVRSAEIQRKDPYELPESLGPDPYRGVD